jgi:hypothetical protein
MRMTKQSLTFYVLDENTIRKRFKRILQGRPLDSLRCSICGRAFELNQKIVRRRRKLYHLECFNNSIFEIDDSILDSQDIALIESGTIPTSILCTIPSTVTIQMSSY